MGLEALIPGTTESFTTKYNERSSSLFKKRKREERMYPGRHISLLATLTCLCFTLFTAHNGILAAAMETAKLEKSTSENTSRGVPIGTLIRNCYLNSSLVGKSFQIEAYGQIVQGTGTTQGYIILEGRDTNRITNSILTPIPANIIYTDREATYTVRCNGGIRLN